MTRRRAARGAACLLAGAALAGTVGGQDAAAPQPEREPLEIGFIEETGVRRLFIDVQAVDARGRPMPGLSADDFRIKLDYLWRRVRSVDDFCPCSIEAGRGVVDEAAGAADPITRREVGMRWVLYFDFSQLAPAGRERAIEHARRWVLESKQPGDEATVVAYATEPGLRVLEPPTADAGTLLAAIERMQGDPLLDDPFPGRLHERVAACASGQVACHFSARKDYFQIRRSLRVLLGFVSRLESMPGRKALLLFHQNLAIFPGRLYAGGTVGDSLGGYMADGEPSDDVPDLLRLVRRVGAAATMARTELHPIVVGGASGWSVNLGANFADFTGGLYNGGEHDAADVVAAAGRGCRCIYRIGVEPPSGRSRVYRVKVKARGRTLPNRYLVHYLTRRDVWLRGAASVLTNPDDSWDLDVGAALVPRREGRQRWGLDVRVALDLAELAPSAESGQRAWEVGALLARHGENKTEKVWQMLGVSRAERGEPLDEESLLIHERTFPDLRPGAYELRAFVRDRNADAYGGARVRLDLPDPRDGGTAGPVILRRHGRHRVAPLPLQDGWRWVEIARADTVDQGWVPLGLRPPRPGEALAFRCWLCPSRDGSTPRPRSRHLTRAGLRLHAFEPAEVAGAGDCVRLDDVLDGAALPPGRYEYRVEGERARPALLAPFEVRDAAAAKPTVIPE